MRRLAIVTSHPIQYQAPWFRALAQVLEIKVFFCHRQDGTGQVAAGFAEPFEWDVPLLSGYPHRWLENVSHAPGVETFAGCDTPAIAAELKSGGFEACLVNGWYLKSYLQAVHASRRLGIPVLMRGDSHLKTPRHWLRAVSKYVPYRWFLTRLDAHLYVGRANYRYLRHFGVRPERLFAAPHFVDNAAFAAGAARARREGTAAALRAAHGIGDTDIGFLFAGKFIEKKRPGDLVEALAAARREDPGLHVLMVGSGVLEETLRRQAARLHVPVHFLGFRNQSELPSCYAAADCLVLPSDGRETWGLVVNEAMACGLPAIVSDAVGCADDLIDADTGLTVPVGDTAALARALLVMARRLRTHRGQMRSAALATVSRYSCEAATAGTLAALDFVTGRQAAAPEAPAIAGSARLQP